jgi:hypothetical protein
MRNKRVVAFKAEEPLTNEEDIYYCRFTLFRRDFRFG